MCSVHGGPHERPVFDTRARARARAGALVQLTVGDNFYDSGVTDVNDPAWTDSWSSVYLGYPSLANLPWYAQLGNHDYDGNPDAEVRARARAQALPPRTH